MKDSIKKISVFALFLSFSMFIFSCNGTTNIHGIEKNKSTKKHYPKHKRKHSTYDARYETKKPIPPGQHKKMHGDKSAKKYTPGHNKGKSNKKHHSKGKRH